MPSRRLTSEEAAALLGVTPSTFRTYRSRSALPLPVPDAAKTWSRKELLDWKKARPGGGKPKGATAQGSPCMKCGQMVERRWKDQRTGLYLCKPDWVTVADLKGRALKAWMADLAVPPKG